MSDFVEDMKALDAVKKSHSAQMRENVPKELRRLGINFSSHNGGAHLIVETKYGFVDYWPGTGKWKSRNVGSGQGLEGLLAYIGIERRPR